jgi:hypothetical protein
MKLLYFVRANKGIKLVEMPITTARITPKKKAFAPKEFSFDLIIIIGIS